MDDDAAFAGVFDYLFRYHESAFSLRRVTVSARLQDLGYPWDHIAVQAVDVVFVKFEHWREYHRIPHGEKMNPIMQPMAMSANTMR
jgi:hypothetical protein